MVQLHPLVNHRSYMPDAECTSHELGREPTFVLLEDASGGRYQTVGHTRDREGVLYEGPIEGGKSRVSVRQKTLPFVEYLKHLERNHLPSKPGGGRGGAAVGSIAKIAVSHRPVGHSLLGGDAKSFWGGVIPVQSWL